MPPISSPTFPEKGKQSAGSRGPQAQLALHWIDALDNGILDAMVDNVVSKIESHSIFERLEKDARAVSH